MKVIDLKPAEYNPRKITNEKLEMLRKSLDEFGDLSGIVYNRRTDRMIGGHQRVKVFSKEWEITKTDTTDACGTVATGFIEMPGGRMTYREVDWPEEKEKAANISANKQGGDFDEPLLRDLINELKISGVDMELTGFDTVELRDILQIPIEVGGSGPNLDPGDGRYKEQYGVIIICKDEASQEEVYNDLSERGYNCRVVTT